jgi:hypothetical protein
MLVQRARKAIRGLASITLLNVVLKRRGPHLEWLDLHDVMSASAICPSVYLHSCPGHHFLVPQQSASSTTPTRVLESLQFLRICLPIQTEKTAAPEVFGKGEPEHGCRWRSTKGFGERVGHISSHRRIEAGVSSIATVVKSLSRAPSISTNSEASMYRIRF